MPHRLRRFARIAEASIYVISAQAHSVSRKNWLLFPGIRVIRMDVDTTTEKGSREAAEAVSDKRGRAARHPDGRQGPGFPDVTLVGVITADSALNLPDFRAAEKTFQPPLRLPEELAAISCRVKWLSNPIRRSIIRLSMQAAMIIYPSSRTS